MPWFCLSLSPDFFQFKRLNQAIVGFPQDWDSARGRTRNDELKSRISHACVSKANAIWISPDQPELMKTSSCLIEFSQSGCFGMSPSVMERENLT